MTPLHRRDILKAAAAFCAPLNFSTVEPMSHRALPSWTTYEVRTRVEVQNPTGVTRVWLPAALATDTPYQRTHTNTFTAQGGQGRLVVEPADNLAFVIAEFPAGVPPMVTVTSRVSTRDHAVDLAGRAATASASASALAHFLRPTKLIPTDGIVRDRARAITRGARTDVAKARAIYDWIVDHTFRDPAVQGCGLGDIRFMLESGNLGGKCADLNALFVGLARAVDLPARDVYGLRVGPSAQGYKSLGVASENVTRAQHCRAEVHLDGLGWVPVDPADVRKVALEEPPGNRALDDVIVAQARARLFGAWEMNWLAFNFAHDVALPGSSRGPVPFLMYPHAETGNGRLDPLAPDQFRYEITAVQITPA